MSLMVDANHAYSVPVAKRMAKELEAYAVRWFEEPVVPEDITGYREVYLCIAYHASSYYNFKSFVYIFIVVIVSIFL